MVLPNGETQPPQALQADAGSTGTEADIEQEVNAVLSQQRSQPDGDPTGAEQTAEKPAERTFSQAEVSKMTSAFQRQTQTVQDQLVTLTRQVATDKAVATESVAKATDARAVDDGEITQTEAVQRERNRTDLAAAEQRLVATQEQTAQLVAENEAEAVIKYAVQNGQEFGIDAQLLLDDPVSVSDPHKMREKAWELRWAKQQAAVVGTETFANTQPGAGGAGGSFNQIEQGYADGNVTYKTYKAARDARGM